MKHRLFIALLGLAITASIVGGVVYWDWPPGPDSGPAESAGVGTTSVTALLPTAGPPAAEGQAGVAAVSPSVIAVNEATDITVTIQITDARLIAGSPNLQRLDASGRVVAVLGTLNDAGTGGDATAGDRVFTIRRSFTEATTPIRLRVSWALRGVLQRATSQAISVYVLALPPDPGVAGQATLAGIDSDGDGLRDEVQRYIELSYSDSARTRAALRQYAGALQSSLMVATDNPGAVRSGTQRADAIRCLAGILGDDRAQVVFAALRARMLNTRDRSRAYIIANAQLGGQVFDAGGGNDDLARCNFDTAALPN